MPTSTRSELTGTAYSIYVNQDSENGVMDVFYGDEVI
mgnify:CR=1 FL=1